jgi:hypothetical protein
MKRYAVTLLVFASIGTLVSFALANPALLPQHPGYPAGKDVSPVTGQPLANDPGQLNLTVEQSTIQGSAAEDAHVSQRLTDSEDQRILEKPGSGLLPKADGPQIVIEPPVAEATRMPQSSERGQEEH